MFLKLAYTDQLPDISELFGLNNSNNKVHHLLNWCIIYIISHDPGCNLKMSLYFPTRQRRFGKLSNLPRAMQPVSNRMVI